MPDSDVIMVDTQIDYISHVYKNGRVKITLFRKGQRTAAHWELCLQVEKYRRFFSVTMESCDPDKGEAWGRLDPDDLMIIRKFYEYRDKMVKLLTTPPKGSRNGNMLTSARDLD